MKNVILLNENRIVHMKVFGEKSRHKKTNYANFQKRKFPDQILKYQNINLTKPFALLATMAVWTLLR